MSSENGQRPNVLLIMTDEHAPDVAGFAGDPFVRSQHLDALAERSVQFATASCPSPLCTPARMCMLTGKEVHRSSAWSNHWVIFPEHTTWPAHFAAHGYRTALVGKMHFGGQDQMQGFQHRPYGDLRHGLGHQPEPLEMFPAYANARSAGITEIPESLLQDVVVTRETLAFLLEHQDIEPNVPWFVCASYGRPHAPLTAPGRYVRRYRGKVPPVALAPDYLEQHEPYARRIAERHQSLTPEESLHGREAYYACVDFVDDCIGELLQGLQARGLLDNTIIIYTSDHGEMLGRHGLWAKSVYYEPSLGVPLLMSGPGINAGHHRVTEPISLLDLFPTTCQLAGLPVPDGLDGVGFGPYLASPATVPAPREFAPSAYYMYGVIRGKNRASMDEPCAAWRAIRERDWKYVEIEGGSPLLFDMVNDPDETINLAGHPEHAERCGRMRDAVFQDFSWHQVHTQLKSDSERLGEFASGLKPTTPNQYMLSDGRVFDAEGDLYAARWLYIPPQSDGGIIPQQFG
jgi:choline-sulfatase